MGGREARRLVELAAALKTITSMVMLLVVVMIMIIRDSVHSPMVMMMMIGIKPMIMMPMTMIMTLMIRNHLRCLMSRFY